MAPRFILTPHPTLVDKAGNPIMIKQCPPSTVGTQLDPWTHRDLINARKDFRREARLAAKDKP